MSINPFGSYHSLRVPRSFILLLVLLAPIHAIAGNLYPMEGGNTRRDNHNLNPSSLANPLKLQWITPPCAQLQNAVCDPIVLSDRVVQSFLDGIRCYDRQTGARIWTWACNSAVSIWNAPCYDGGRDRLYQCFYNGDTVALDAQTGNVVWYYPHKSSGWPQQFSGPLLAEGKLFVGNGGQGFLCLDPDTRQVIWEFDFNDYLGTTNANSTCTPAYDNGYVYLPLLDGNLFCLNAATGAVQWHVKEDLYHVNCPLLSDEYIYVMGSMSQVECRNRTDGSLVWTADTHQITGSTNGNLALCGDILIVPGDSHHIWGLNRYTGQVIWNVLLGGNFAINSPFVVCGKVYVSACLGDYYCLDGQTGKVEWDYHHGANGTFVGWAEADGQLFVGDSAGKMRCFTSVTPGNPVTCACNLSATPVFNYTPSPFATPIYDYPNPNCANTATFTPTVTFTPTATFTLTGSLTPSDTPAITDTPTETPSPTLTFTPSPTFTPIPSTYANSDTAVAAALGVTPDIVDEARDLDMPPDIVYIIIRISHHCGCHPHDIMTMRLTMGWDEIAQTYGVDWITLMNDIKTLTVGLVPESTTVNQILRGDANDPSYFPIEPTSTPVPVGMPLSFNSPAEGAACP